MKRDVFGICLSPAMLLENLNTTFTHVRAYKSNNELTELEVIEAFPQLSGKQLLNTMTRMNALLWRAEFSCQNMK